MVAIRLSLSANEVCQTDLWYALLNYVVQQIPQSPISKMTFGGQHRTYSTSSRSFRFLAKFLAASWPNRCREWQYLERLPRNLQLARLRSYALRPAEKRFWVEHHMHGGVAICQSDLVPACRTCLLPPLSLDMAMGNCYTH